MCVCVSTQKGIRIKRDKPEHRVVKETQLKCEHTCDALLNHMQKVNRQPEADN